MKRYKTEMQSAITTHGAISLAFLMIAANTWAAEPTQVFAALDSARVVSTTRPVSRLPTGNHSRVTGPPCCSYRIVDTDQAGDYTATFGEDSDYAINPSSYTDNGDGTVTDNITGLMWQQSPDLNRDGVIDADDKMYYEDALAGASTFNLAGHGDWRLPTIKELYSLIHFNGAQPSPSATSQGNAAPFIDTDYFDFDYGDLNAGDRLIDAQYASSTTYVSTTMGGNETMFGVNFADGRIKGYPSAQAIGKKYYVLYVRGNRGYGRNAFMDNGDGTVTDHATGLMWMKDDNGQGILWEDALRYAENFEYAGHGDWRLPTAKELQSIVDYHRSPATTGSAAINPILTCTQITNEAGNADYPYYMTSTTLSSAPPMNNMTGVTPPSGAPENGGGEAVYIAFGRGMGYMVEYGGWIDVHGAGSQKSDPKAGDPTMFPQGHGPQGDAIRIYNYVRLVRSAK